MQKWEYLHLTWSLNGNMSVNGKSVTNKLVGKRYVGLNPTFSIGEVMQALGKDGWDFVFTIRREGEGDHLFFKRPLLK